MNEAQILTWAAGAPEDVTGIGEIDPERLFALLRAHNLVSRFFHRCQLEKPPWYRRALSIPAWEQTQAIKRRTFRQIAAVQEIAEALPPDAHPLIVIKGPATFAMTGDRRHLRWSGDLDLLCRDSLCLWESLLQLGYRGERNDSVDETKSAAHEFAVLARDDVVIEIHDYFPVARYPDEVRSADLVPSHHPGRWVQRLPGFLPSQITFDLLAAHSMNGVGPDTRRLRIPDPAASILILCAHEFRNFLHSPFTGMTVRLSALADVYDLARDSRFDAGRFLSLMAETGPGDSAAFAASLLQSLYGHNPLPVTASAFEGACFPQALSYSGGWAALAGLKDVLLMSGTETFAANLGLNRILAPASGSSRTYATVPEGAANQQVMEALPRLVLNSPLAPRIEMNARHEPDVLHLSVTFLDPLPNGAEYEVYVQFRHQAHGPDAWGWKFLDANQFHHSPVLEFAFRRTALPRQFRETKRVPMILAIGQFRRRERLAAGWFNGNAVEPLAIIPLEITCES